MQRGSAALVNTNDLPRSEAIQSNLTTSLSTAPVTSTNTSTITSTSPAPPPRQEKCRGDRRPAPDQRLHPEHDSADTKTVVRNGNTTFCSHQYSHTAAARILTKPLQAAWCCLCSREPRCSIHTTTQPRPEAELIRDGKVGIRKYRAGAWGGCVIYNSDR